MIEIYDKIIKLVKENPNDMKLGSKLRSYMEDFIIAEQQYKDVVAANTKHLNNITNNDK